MQVPSNQCYMAILVVDSKFILKMNSKSALKDKKEMCILINQVRFQQMSKNNSK